MITRDRFKGCNESCVTEQSRFLENVSLNKFRKIAYIECFFDFFRRFMLNYAKDIQLSQNWVIFHLNREIPTLSNFFQKFPAGALCRL